MPPRVSKKFVEGSKAFCMVPWISLNIGPNGDVRPCCTFDPGSPVGSLRTSSLKEIWNSKELRAVRLAMLKDDGIPQCARCRQLEATGAPSIRRRYNENYAAYLPLAERTHEDGSLDRFSPPLLDIWFSNACNLKCRYCGPDRSTNWYNDHGLLYAERPRTAVLTSTEAPEDLVRQVEPLIPGLERIYFSGGEPLIMPEHYRLLNLLIERKRTDVELVYSTNFSMTVFRGRDVFELWSRFRSVTVGASLDAKGRRGEYIRKNLDWARVVENRERMLRICPGARFKIGPTLSVMNALHIPEFHREWIEKGYIGPSDIGIGIVFDPEELRAQVLPERLKREMADRYERHVEWLAGRYGPDADRAAAYFRAAINFAWAEDRSGSLEEFRRKTRALDQIRGERFEDVFPELAELMS